MSVAVLLPRWKPDNPLVAAGCVALGILMFATQDMMSKVLIVDYSPFEIAWVRYGLNTILLLPFILRSRGHMLRTKMPVAQTIRSLAVSSSAVLFMAALAFLPQPEATSISFLSPLLVTALSIPLLGEKVGVRRWMAVVIGFVGMLVIVRPGTGAFQPAALFPVASATCWALGLILTRRLSGTDSGPTTLAYSTIIPAGLFTLVLPFVWTPPHGRAIAIMLAMGVVSILAQYLTILGYSQRPASSLAPITYTQLIWASMYGFLIFGDVPSAWTWLGAIIIMLSGLYTFRRERIVGAIREPGPVVGPAA